MPKTRADLVTRVLQELGAVAVGQQPAAEDVSLVDGNLEPVAAELAADEVVFIADLDQIDDAAFLPLAICVAQRMASDFGVAMDAVKVAGAEARLRRMGRNGPKYTPQPTSYV